MSVDKCKKSGSSYLEIDGCSITVEEISRVARDKAKVSLGREALKRVCEARMVVERIIKNGKVVYGINTGFGKFSEIVIPGEDLLSLQNNLIASHAAAVGKPLSEEVVRAAMLLRANALAKGHSGVRPEVIMLLLDMLNCGIHPVVPSQGSLGASGDLAPLSHIALVLTGRGEAIVNGERTDGAKALAAAGLKPLELQEKEGLALINGTQVMTALAALAVHDAANLIKTADIVASLSLEALQAHSEAFSPLIYEVRAHPGQKATINNILKLVHGSRHFGNNRNVQDAYSLRCIPQVHGASKDAFKYIKSVVDIEINSATDNPLIFPKEELVLSGGNFHGQPVAQVMDFFCIAISELGSISERRVERMLNASLSGLPPFLSRQGGLNSGYMIAQYTAASLVSENKLLANPASVDSISCSAAQEDHVSMGTTSARKARQVVKNISYILGAEYLVAAQAIEFFPELFLGRGTSPAYDLLRLQVPALDNDRILSDELEKAKALVFSGALVQAVEEKLDLEAYS